MLSRRAHRGLTWIDLESPTPSEVRSLMDEFDIDPRAAEELLKPSLKSKVDRYEGGVYLILHFPVASQGSVKVHEIDFIVGKDHIITVSYDSVDPLLKFARFFEARSLLDSHANIGGAGHVLCTMLGELYRSLEGELDSISASLSRIEERIFGGQERAMVIELSRIARELLAFKQALGSHTSMLESLEAPGVHLFGQGFSYRLRGAISELFKVMASLQSERDMLTELRLTNDSLLTTKQNETIKNLTVMAFITLPLSLLASLFGMNVEHTPIVGHPFDFWLVVGLMCTIALCLFAYFSAKKWL